MLRLWVWLADRLINWPIDWLTDLLVSFIRSSPLPAVGGELSGVEVCLTSVAVLTEGANADRLDDQLCRMSWMGVRTGPIDPGFCPSEDEAVATEVELRQRLEVQVATEVELRKRLEAQVAQLRLELARSSRT
jgi:hypothetical protein